MDRHKIEARLAQAVAAGVSQVDVALVGVLLNSMIKSVREISPGRDNTQLSLVTGMALAATITLENPEAGGEMLRVLGYMLNEQEAIEHIRQETAKFYLETRTEQLAREGRRG